MYVYNRYVNKKDKKEGKISIKIKKISVSHIEIICGAWVGIDKSL